MWAVIWFVAQQPNPALLQINTKLLESEAFEREGRIGSAFSAAIAAQDLALATSDPGLHRLYAAANHDDGPRTPVEGEALRLHAIAQDRIRALANASTLNFSVNIIASSDIVVEQNGVVIPIDDWGKSHYLDPGSYVWTARLGTWEFFRYTQDVKQRDSHVSFQVLLPIADPPAAPPPAQLAR